MDLDIDQVFMYILHGPLFSVVDHISFLYLYAASTTDTRVKEVLIAVAKETMNIMLLFDVGSHRLDFRITIPRRYLRIISFAEIASKSCAFRLACAYAPACCSAAALVITRLVDKINDEVTKNVLRHLIEEFNRISMEFQSVSEMIFRDRPINPEIIRPFILQQIRPWIPYIPPFPVPRVDDQLVYSGLLTEPMLGPISTALYYFEEAIGQTYWLHLSLEDDVAVDRIFNVLTYMVIVQSFLDHHFPENIQTARPEDHEDELVWDRREQVQWMLSQVSDIAIMALVEIESVILSTHSQELEKRFEYLVEIVLTFTSELYPAYMQTD